MPDDMQPRADAAESADLDDSSLRRFVGYNIRRAWLALRATRTPVLAEFGLRTVSFSALSMIADNPGIIQSRLAAALRMERSNIVVVIDELESRGLIARGRSAQDRRVYALRATPAGRRLRDGALAGLVEHEERMTAGLSATERRQLVEFLQRIEGQEGRAGE